MLMTEVITLGQRAGCFHWGGRLSLYLKYLGFGQWKISSQLEFVMWSILL